jgi:hypothetical protein
MNDELSRAHWQVTKQLLEVARQQQSHIERLTDGYTRILDAMRGKAALEDLPALDGESQAKLEAELAELERLFSAQAPEESESE